MRRIFTNFLHFSCEFVEFVASPSISTLQNPEEPLFLHRRRGASTFLLRDPRYQYGCQDTVRRQEQE